MGLAYDLDNHDIFLLFNSSTLSLSNFCEVYFYFFLNFFSQSYLCYFLLRLTRVRARPFARMSVSRVYVTFRGARLVLFFWLMSASTVLLARPNSCLFLRDRSRRCRLTLLRLPLHSTDRIRLSARAYRFTSCGSTRHGKTRHVQSPLAVIAGSQAPSKSAVRNCL